MYVCIVRRVSGSKVLFNEPLIINLMKDVRCGCGVAATFCVFYRLSNALYVTYRLFWKKCVFFTIHWNSFLAYIAVIDLKSSQRNASVQSLILAGNFFFTTNSSRVLAREKWQTFENSWKKNTIFNEHPAQESYTDSPIRQ